MSDSNSLTTIGDVASMMAHASAVHELVKGALIEGIDNDYAVIPGTKKKSLLQPGAQKIALYFALAPDYQIMRHDSGDGHREYEIVCTLTHRHTGMRIAQGVGSCSTMENKYRWRQENTGALVPSEYWETRDPSILGGPQFTPRKIDRQWMIFQRSENIDIADCINTVLKMAKKRAYIDAVITATASAGIFTQDMEEAAAAFAETAAAAKTEAAPSPCITEEQQMELVKLIKECGADGGKFLAYLGVEALDKLPQSKLASAKHALNEKRRKTV